MENDFIIQFEHFLKSSYQGVAEPYYPVNSPFKAYLLPEYHLILHLVDYKTLRQNALHENFFQQMSVGCSLHHIQILHIWEDYWFNKNFIIAGRIRNYLKANKKISARACQLLKLDKPEADVFFNSNHLQGATTYYYKMGLLHKNILVAALAFSKSRVMTDGPNLYRSYELVRYSNLQEFTVTGGLGKLLKMFVNQQHLQHLMTYIDLDWGMGKSFIKHGFALKEYASPNHFMINTLTNHRTYYKSELMQTQNHPKIIAGFNAGSAKLILDLRKL